jgi:hypothetical protein
MDHNVVLCRPVSLIHKSTELKRGLITIQNEFVSIFSNIHPLKVPVHKIQFHFTFCIMELGNQVCYMAANAVLLHFVLRTRRSPFAVQFMPEVVLEISELAPILSSFSSVSTCLLHVLKWAYAWNLFTYL